MKLALFVHGGLDRTGEERVIPALLWLLERLARDNEVHAFVREQERAPAEWPLLGARVHNIGMTAGRRRRLLSSFAQEHRRAPFDALHGFFAWGGSWGAAIGRFHSLRVVFHAAGGEFASLPDIGYGCQTKVSERLKVRFAASNATVVTVATHEMQQLAHACDVSAQVVPLGVALDRWPVRPPTPRVIERPIRLLHVADQRDVKDQVTLLRAMALLTAAGKDFTLDICGRDTLNGELQRSADAKAIAHRTRWHGHLGRARVRGLMEQADLLVVSSRHEAGPLVVLEAAVAGVPTVGTRVGHIADWSGRGAWAVEPQDATSLALAVAALMDDEPRRLALAREAQRLATVIDADFSARSFQQLYSSVAVS